MSAHALDTPELRGPAYEWSLWSTTMRVVTSDPRALSSAKRLIDAELARVELAVSHVRPDSEVRSLPTGRRVRVSETLTEILGAALDAARETDGVVAPTLGRGLESIGGETDSAGRWQRIDLDVDQRLLTMPKGVLLDLGATAKAWAADRCASVVADLLGVGVLVSLGGDIATAGPEGFAGRGGWEVLVQDQDEDPAALVAIPTGLAVATSSTTSREWLAGGRELHHILNPSTGMPVSRVWRSATVVAPDCVTANTWSTAALVDGLNAPEVLAERGYPARLVAADGSVRHLVGWPEDAELT